MSSNYLSIAQYSVFSMFDEFLYTQIYVLYFLIYLLIACYYILLLLIIWFCVTSDIDNIQPNAKGDRTGLENCFHHAGRMLFCWCNNHWNVDVDATGTCLSKNYNQSGLHSWRPKLYKHSTPKSFHYLFKKNIQSD